ncbi:MAG: hypothetical protein WKF43_11670, partial [Acidimicrobiales bacterium]
NFVSDANGNKDGGVNDAQYAGIKSANFASNRRNYFHYNLNIHRYQTSSGSSGQAELPGNDLITSLQCFTSTVNVANTIMHEVGHNVDLRHGGFENLPNFKPNYNSVMNYRWQFPGVDTNCDLTGDNELDYSTGGRATLDEFNLSETLGICNGVDIDWNGNGSIEGGTVAVDVTQDGIGSTLVDNNDWADVRLGFVTEADGAPVVEPQLVTEQPVPTSAR